MDAQIQFGKIHIIEWLDPGELRTGRDLFNELQPMGLMSRPQVEVAYQPVRDRNEFIACLRGIPADARRVQRLPLLQIDAHGIYADGSVIPVGIGLSGDDAILWPELNRELVPINMLSGLRLPVMMASCAGLWGIKMAQPVERAPFLAIFGPNRDVSADEVSRACLAFYRTIFGGGRGETAITAMNTAVGPKPITFGAYNVEKLFREVVEMFFVKACTEEAMALRVTSLYTRMVARWFNEQGCAPPPKQMAAIRAFAQTHIEGHEEWFENLKRNFFMIDLAPENAERFPVTLEECRAGLNIEGLRL